MTLTAIRPEAAAPGQLDHAEAPSERRLVPSKQTERLAFRHGVQGRIESDGRACLEIDVAAGITRAIELEVSQRAGSEQLLEPVRARSAQPLAQRHARGCIAVGIALQPFRVFAHGSRLFARHIHPRSQQSYRRIAGASRARDTRGAVVLPFDEVHAEDRHFTGVSEHPVSSR